MVIFYFLAMRLPNHPLPPSHFGSVVQSTGSLKSDYSRSSIMFADWLAELKTTPDPRMTEKHVTTMVEVRIESGNEYMAGAK